MLSKDLQADVKAATGTLAVAAGVISVIGNLAVSGLTAAVLPELSDIGTSLGKDQIATLWQVFASSYPAVLATIATVVLFLFSSAVPPPLVYFGIPAVWAVAAAVAPRPVVEWVPGQGLPPLTPGPSVSLSPTGFLQNFTYLSSVYGFVMLVQGILLGLATVVAVYRVILAREKRRAAAAAKPPSGG